jgi:hypothetical protein
MGKMKVLYRCEREDAWKGNPKKKSSTMRPPGNVPYVVDNLWEWKRPEGYPCRRFALFASPTPELALESARHKGRVFGVEPRGNVLLAQIEERDAKWHADCRNLKNMLRSRLMKAGWMDLSLGGKWGIAPLWAPCLSRGEVDLLFRLEPLRDLREEIWDSITFWDNVIPFKPENDMPFAEGEVFLESDEWVLHPLEEEMKPAHE